MEDIYKNQIVLFTFCYSFCYFFYLSKWFSDWMKRMGVYALLLLSNIYIYIYTYICWEDSYLPVDESSYYYITCTKSTCALKWEQKVTNKIRIANNNNYRCIEMTMKNIIKCCRIVSRDSLCIEFHDDINDDSAVHAIARARVSFFLYLLFRHAISPLMSANCLL